MVENELFDSVGHDLPVMVDRARAAATTQDAPAVGAGVYMAPIMAMVRAAATTCHTTTARTDAAMLARVRRCHGCGRVALAVLYGQR